MLYATRQGGLREKWEIIDLNIAKIKAETRLVSAFRSYIESDK